MKLVVEVDGMGHARRQSADERRDERLRRMGYRVLRVQAVAVHRELAAVLERVRDALGHGRGEVSG